MRERDREREIERDREGERERERETERDIDIDIWDMSKDMPIYCYRPLPLTMGFTHSQNDEKLLQENGIQL